MTGCVEDTRQRPSPRRHRTRNNRRDAPPYPHLSALPRAVRLGLVLVRFRVVSLVALVAAIIGAADAAAQIRPNPAAAAAARRAFEADARAVERSREGQQRPREEAIDPFEATADIEVLDAFEGIDDPLDEIDDYGELDPEDTYLEPADALFDSNPARVEVPDVPDPTAGMDALGGFDDERAREDREDSIARRMYEAAEAELDTPTEAGTDLPDAGLDLDPFIEP